MLLKAEIWTAENFLLRLESLVNLTATTPNIDWRN